MLLARKSFIASRGLPDTAALGVPAKLPGALDGCAPAEPLGLVRVQAA